MLTREIHSFFSVVSSLAEELGSRLQAGRSVGQGRAASQHRHHYSRSLHQRRFPFRGIASLPLLELFSPRKEFPEVCSGYRRPGLPEQAASGLPAARGAEAVLAAGCDWDVRGATGRWAAAGEPSRAGFGPPGALCRPWAAAQGNARLQSLAALHTGEL